MHLYFTVGTLERDAGDAEGCALRSLRAVLLRGLHGHAHIHQSQCRWADERVLCVTTVSLARQPDTNCCCSLSLSVSLYSAANWTPLDQVSQAHPVRHRRETLCTVQHDTWPTCATHHLANQWQKGAYAGYLPIYTRVSVCASVCVCFGDCVIVIAGVYCKLSVSSRALVLLWKCCWIVCSTIALGERQREVRWGGGQRFRLRLPRDARMSVALH